MMPGVWFLLVWRTLVVGPSPSKPGKASEWLNELADLDNFSSALWRSCLLNSGSFSDTNFTRNSAPYSHRRRRATHVTSFVSCFSGQTHHSRRNGLTHYMNSYVGCQGEYPSVLSGSTRLPSLKNARIRFPFGKEQGWKTLFDVKVELKDETDWSALGYYISER